MSILVEKALKAWRVLDFSNSNKFKENNFYNEKRNLDKASKNNNDFEELISDNGITYNNKNHKYNLMGKLLEPRE